MLVLPRGVVIYTNVLGSSLTSRKAQPETSKKGAKRVKSPKSKSPAPAIPIPPSTPESGPTAEGEEFNDPVRLLKGHDTEVHRLSPLTLLTQTKSAGLRLCMEPCSSRRAGFGVSILTLCIQPLCSIYAGQRTPLLIYGICPRTRAIVNLTKQLIVLQRKLTRTSHPWTGIVTEHSCQWDPMTPCCAYTWLPVNYTSKVDCIKCVEPWPIMTSQ